jgi:hypothetical protein
MSQNQTEEKNNLPVRYSPEIGGYKAPVATARMVTSRTEHLLCNPHDTIKEVLRLARQQKTPARLHAIIGMKAVMIDINPNYIILIEYLGEDWD